MIEIGLWIVLGIVLLGLEIFIVSLGMLFIGALACFYWAYLLLNMPLLSHDPLRVQILAGIIFCGLSFLAYLALDTWRRKHKLSTTKKEQARVIHLDSSCEGQAEWRGERWHFRSKQELKIGDDVTIDSVEGLTITVSKREGV
ncbi:MAG: hypothetical protein RJB66_1878 [Pseudomonadota bacterium]|jgi:membrane protein implicated in regulation of membrane protease activity